MIEQYLTSHLLKYEWNFAGGGGHSLLWLEATTFLNYIDIYLTTISLNMGGILLAEVVTV